MKLSLILLGIAGFLFFIFLLIQPSWYINILFGIDVNVLQPLYVYMWQPLVYGVPLALIDLLLSVVCFVLGVAC